MKKFTIIIPTMWLHPYITVMSEIYDKNPYIDEIIIIDNNPNHRFSLIESDKITYHTKGHNIYVNPAWNWGVSLASNENIILANDDIFIYENQFNNLLSTISENLTDDMIIGPDPSSFNNTNFLGNEIILHNHMQDLTYGYGTFMCLTKASYVPIPDDVLIWYGDNILHDNNNAFRFLGVNIITPMSVTVFHSHDTQNVVNQDRNTIRNYNIKSLAKIK